MSKALTLFDDTGKQVILPASAHIESGGEGDVYGINGVAYKIYHDPKKMIPAGKIKELMQIKRDSIIVPLSILEGKDRKPVGFTMRYVTNFEFLCKLFNKGYRHDNKITPDMVAKLVRQMQEDLSYIHSKGVLVVDYNEMNFLISRSFDKVYNIDTDSYQTPSFPPTAIMESIRDRQVKDNNFTEGSDWFSWAVIAFSLYMGTHPYKSTNPAYRRKEWAKMMDKNISVFHPDSKLPPATQDWSVLPKPHAEYFKKVFHEGHRGTPPLADGIHISPVAAPQKPVIIVGTTGFTVELVGTFKENIVDAKRVGSELHVMTDKGVYAGNKKFVSLSDRSSKKILLSSSHGNTISYVEFNAPVKKAKLVFGEKSEMTGAEGIVEAHGNFYIYNQGYLTEHRFINMGGKLVAVRKQLSQTFKNSKVFEGCVVAKFAGNTYFSIPYTTGSAAKIHIPELDEHRILSAKYSKGFLIVVGEHKGKYSRFVFCMDEKCSSYSLRRDDDQDLDNVNFVTLDKGLCVQIVGDEYVEGFLDNSRIKRIDNPPFNSSMKMYVDGDTIYFASNKMLYKVSTK
jgi:hypothetical protein